jgi:hypothetical protein
VYREGDSTAASQPKPVDFYSPDTFNYTDLGVSADGGTLTVTTYGINSYATNTFPEPSAVGPEREILSFQIDAIPEPASWVMMCLGTGGLVALARRRRAQKAAESR